MQYVAASVLTILLLLAPPVAAQSTRQQTPSAQQLAKWLEQYPEADANDDGVLSVEEARAYRRKLERQRAETTVQPERDFRSEFTFATMSDGVRIALAVGFPPQYDPDETTRKWPAMFEMMGYPDSTVPKSPGAFGNRYVTVRASVRGAGASGGMIRAVSPRTGRDGYEIIENWIVKQPWSNGKVALHGHSWGGLTGFTIAATAPPHLSAVAVSGLFDDVYRDIGCIGGIRNSGFPVEWMINLYRPTGPFNSGAVARQARGMTRTAYEEILAARPAWDLTESVLWKSLHGREYQDAFAQASPGTFASQVRAPIHIMHAYQDEQTGPSGAWLWKYLPDDIAKRLVLTNGDHGEVRRFNRERMQWLDFWTLGDRQHDPAGFADPEGQVQVYFETRADVDQLNAPLVARDFPLPDTQWKRCYLGENQRLTYQPPEADSAGDTYSVAVGRGDQTDGLQYRLSFDQATALCGPITVSLWIRCSTLDTDLFVMVADVDPDGTAQLLQRGLLRASHRQLDEQASCWRTRGDQRLLIRPRHTHRDPQPLTPNEPCQVDIEIFPVGHVFREGHQLALWISQPPLGDPVTRRGDGERSYKYASAQPPATVTVLRDRQHPSSVLLPLLDQLPPISAQSPRPGEHAGVHVW